MCEQQISRSETEETEESAVNKPNDIKVSSSQQFVFAGNVIG
jgi:hypothetical protein